MGLRQEQIVFLFAAGILGLLVYNDSGGSTTTGSGRRRRA